MVSCFVSVVKGKSKPGRVEDPQKVTHFLIDKTHMMALTTVQSIYKDCLLQPTSCTQIQNLSTESWLGLPPYQAF